MGQRLSDEQWKTIFGNLKGMEPEDYYDGASWVEIIWSAHYGWYMIAYGEELYEDGFETEKEAKARLRELENRLL